MIQASFTHLLPPNSTFAYTVEPFFYFNLLWRIREVDRPLYNMYNVADTNGARLPLVCLPMNNERIVAFLLPLIDPDDWVDIVLLSGVLHRNVQRIH